MAWLEPTKKCNLYCEGCYSETAGRGHKPLEQVKEEVLTYKKLRNFDSMSIAGGDPLVHPDIVEIVKFVAEQGLKPILNTNGLALTEEILRE
ncbi:MAG: radical SAM protein, partial [Spirochaetota bacterium]|nr:radical SAM protein [Spirochaetota bacterium]